MYEKLKYGFSHTCNSSKVPEIVNSLKYPLCQILLKNSLSTKDLQKINFKNYENIIFHVKYQYNLGSVYFNSNSFQKYYNSFNFLKNESTVIHFGKKMSGATLNFGMSVICKNIERIEKNNDLIFEFAAGQQNEMGSTLEELRWIQEHLDFNMKTCIDTQHVFARGLLDFSSVDDVSNFIDSIEDITNIKSEIFHINDSLVKFGSRVDRHQVPGKGYIWKNRSEDSFNFLLEEAIENNIKVVFEN